MRLRRRIISDARVVFLEEGLGFRCLWVYHRSWRKNRCSRIAVDRNLFEIDPTEISEAKVLLTLLDGLPVHGNLESLER
jgi:hypothetical protein